MIVNEARATAVVARRARWTHVLPPVAAVVVDLVVIVAVVALAYLGRTHLPFFREVSDVEVLVSTVGTPVVLGWLALIALHGGYAGHLMGAGTQEYKQVIRASLVTFGAIGVASFLWKVPFSRGLFFLLVILGLPLLVVGRYALRLALHRTRRAGRLVHRVVVAGSAAQVDEVVGVLHRERWLGYEVVGAVVPADEAAEETPRGVPVLGTTARTAAVVAEHACDVVLFAGGAVASAQQMRRAAWDLAASDVQIMLVPSLTDVSGDRVRVRPAAGLQLMELEGPRAHRASRVSKRLFDVVGAGALLVLASPVLLATALAVRLEDRGPALFRQQRVGRDGSLFDCYKFRSMVVGAPTLTATVANMHDEDHVLFKAAEDPRITRTGRLIRRYSVDELPQLLNVVRGEMSLVGPRPSLPHEVERYTDDVRQRLAVRPGMTGLWQVSGRSDLSWEDSVRLDLYYVDNWSLVQDLAILARTVSAVLGARGAY